MAKKKKIRVALRKNRQKRTRSNDLTRQFRHDEPGAGASPSSDRVRPRGELSRHRTIIEEAGASEVRDAAGMPLEASALRAFDSAACLQGRVLCVHGLVLLVRADDGRTYPCHVRGLLKNLAIEGRNVVTVGDRVWFRPGGSAGAEGMIERIEARRGVITRGYRNRQQVIAANVDQVLIVSALAEPGLKLGLVDRYLVSAEIGGVRPVVVFNKADLVDMAIYQWVVGLYSQLGYETVVTSVADGRGVDRLRDLVSRGVTAVYGAEWCRQEFALERHSAGLEPEVREVSDWTFKGKHTTTTAELIELEVGGFVVDTPGLRQFELWGVVPGELEAYFVEFRPFIPHCRFPDCSHTHETGCAVKDAVYWGQIHSGRYESYRKLYQQQPLPGE